MEIVVGSKFSSVGAIAYTYRQRRKGLSRINRQDAPESLTFHRCRSVHTFGMRFDLQLVYLNRDLKVLGSAYVKPRRIAFGPRGTYSIVEIPV